MTLHHVTYYDVIIGWGCAVVKVTVTLKSAQKCGK